MKLVLIIIFNQVMNMKLLYKNAITIRTIEEKDKGSYLRLYSETDFGSELFGEPKPPIYYEEQIITDIIEKRIISEEILILEKRNQLIGYAVVARESENIYHIGQLVITRKERNKGYGTFLLQIIKNLAANDNSNITLECLTSATSFFKKQGFELIGGASYIFKNNNKSYKPGISIFPPYDIIKQEIEQSEKQRAKIFMDFLDSPLFKNITDML